MYDEPKEPLVDRPERETEIPAAISSVRQEADRIQHLVGQLHKRLRDVSRPSQDPVRLADGDGRLDEVRKASHSQWASPLARGAGEIQGVLFTTRLDLEQILEALEL